MTKEQQKVWAKELESGKWGQCRGALHNSDKTAFCCLGVAEQVLGVKRKIDTTVYSLLDEEFLDDDNQFKLAGMNDAGRSFKEIAAVVRTLPTSD